jgi:extradiol dioxygenase family protein
MARRLALCANIAHVTMTLGQVAVASADLDADKAFYGDLLGLRVIDFRQSGGQVLLVLLGESRLFISAAEDPRFQSRPVLYLKVEDLDAQWARLVDAGAEVMSEPHVVHKDDSMQTRTGFIFDPSGTPLGIMEETRFQGAANSE